jgi:hypothetical protein
MSVARGFIVRERAEFRVAVDEILSRIRQHTPRSGTALFFLGQYGYAEVPATLIRRIFQTSRNAEVVLTFHVSSFATYMNDEFAQRISATLQIDIFKRLVTRSIEQIKEDETDWRRFIQAALYEALVEQCGAAFFTPFFIRGTGAGHGEYWLVHLGLIPGRGVFCTVPLKRKKGRPVPRLTRRVHCWMLRRMRKRPGEMASKLQKAPAPEVSKMLTVEPLRKNERPEIETEAGT